VVSGNKSIGRFHLDGIPPAPRGMPQVEVTFDIDANGILHVSAKDRATGKEQSIRIEASSGLSESDIQRMVQDAEVHAGEDQKRKESVEARNKADALAYEVEKNLKEHGDKIDAGTKSEIETELGRVREALKTEDTARITAAAESLQQAWHKAAAQLYQSAGTPGGGGAAPGGGPDAGTEPKPKKKEGDGPVDADFEVVN
jgi:molecular chaperone DnaK